MNLNLLPHLRALLERRSVPDAAKAMGISVASMSQALTQLRHSLADPLLAYEPDGRTTLSERGQELLPLIRGPLEQLEVALGQASSFDALRDTVNFRIAMSDRFAHALVPRVVAVTGERVAIEVVPDRGPPVPERLASGEVGLWITSDPGEDSEELRVSPLFTEEWVVLFGADAPVEAPRSLEGYLAAQHVGMSPARLDRADGALARLGYERDVRVRLPYFLAAAQLVASTPLLFTGPSASVAQFAARPLLGAAPIPFEIPGLQVSVVWHVRRERDPRLVWLREALIASFELDADGLSPGERAPSEPG